MLPCETRWPALQQAGIDGLFSVALLSYSLGVRKPEPLFYRLVLAAAEAPAEQVLFVGDNLDCDVVAPLAHGMRAALVRPRGLRPGEALPDGALLIKHVRDLPHSWRQCETSHIQSRGTRPACDTQPPGMQ
jgi:putative hydrolase of the HAD superfamily